MAANSLAEFRALVGRVQQASHPDIKFALIRIAGESKEKLVTASPLAAVFFESLRQSLGQLKGHANADLRISCLLDCANYFYVAGDSFKGLSPAREALALARVVQNDLLARKAFTFLGNILSDCGAPAEGIESLVAAAELCKKLKDEHGYVSTMINIGCALFYVAQYRDAIACFESAESAIEDSPAMRSFRPGALTTKALCYLYLENIEDGLICAQQAIAESPSPVSGSEILSRIVRECNYIQLLLEAGKIKLAANRLPAIRDLALRARSQKALVLSSIVEGLIEIHQGDVYRGIELLLYAKTEAGNVNSLLQDALAALVKGYELIDQNAKALEYLHELMQKLGSSKKEYALLQMRGELGLSCFCETIDTDLRALKHREAVLRAKIAEDKLAWSQIEMLERLAVTADLREESSGEHGYRVGRLSAALAEDLGWSSDACLAIDLAARLHDIGKIAVPDRILLTSQELKDAERHFMCTHTLIGAELLAKSNIAQLRMAEDIALYHHEWWDGSGYPKKLSGKRIPIHARIVALADVFDALTHGRPYSPPWSMDRAVEEIRGRKGTQFDPDLTDRFLVLIAQLREKHANLDEFLGRAGRNSPFLQARRKIKLMLAGEREHEQKANVVGNETRH